MKALWANGRVMTNASVFRIDWEDLQLNLPNQFVPGQFFIDNAGAAVSSGVEVEVSARARGRHRCVRFARLHPRALR